MKIRSITFTQRFNMGNYEHIEITAMAEIEEQEAADTAMQHLKGFVQRALNKNVEEKTAPAPAPVVHDTTPIEVAVEVPKKEKKAKKEKASLAVIDPKELPPVEPEGFISEPIAKNVVTYDSTNTEHKSILAGYLSKKYDSAWKTVAPAEEIKKFTASLNGQPFLDDTGAIVPVFLEQIHTFFGA